MVTRSPKGKMTFERCADAALDKVHAIYAQRGGEYQDSWATGNSCFAVTKATLKRFGIELSADQMRLIQLASLIDVKDSRLQGPWTPDSIVDGLAYRAVYLTLREEFEANNRLPGVPCTYDPSTV